MISAIRTILAIFGKKTIASDKQRSFKILTEYEGETRKWHTYIRVLEFQDDNMCVALIARKNCHDEVDIGLGYFCNPLPYTYEPITDDEFYKELGKLTEQDILAKRLSNIG